MPWSKNDYPESMKNLPDDIRDKAIEIANALLEEDYSEGRAISIGIAQARKYIEGDDDNRPEYHVEPDGEDWILKKKDGLKAIMREETKKNLLDRAKEYVNDRDGMLVIHKTDGSVSDRLYD
ncbi:MAG TPA: DUF2188 domain-containing protein [Bacillus bacterium]|uniref:DUF2188 domain-containing protein n=1 Tax=Siminovitchia fordii TaxID=254759 RepID=A0ABQ4K3W1_9BACI|nr:DUF2188 domain-containing protein [Siminovitchia fordii]GIN19847.1 hypothetical protein J1TS3_09810 [Siminovitchia fordii]HBZ10931.1 DUF2188 domain-containing protein [Bacillus sp. (in: firmicutes)]